jgi:hypothetical protein
MEGSRGKAGMVVAALALVGVVALALAVVVAWIG